MATDNEMNMTLASIANALGQGQGQAHGPMLGMAQAQQGLMAQNAAAMNWPPTVADTVKQLRKTYAAKQKVLEFLEAQLALDLFKDDPDASTIYQDCVITAIRHMEKPQ